MNIEQIQKTAEAIYRDIIEHSGPLDNPDYRKISLIEGHLERLAHRGEPKPSVPPQPGSSAALQQKAEELFKAYTDACGQDEEAIRACKRQERWLLDYTKFLLVDGLDRGAGEQEALTQWIAVEDRLPEECEKVLVTIGDTVLVGRLFSNGWVAFFSDGEYPAVSRRVTHWQPLPAPAP